MNSSSKINPEELLASEQTIQLPPQGYSMYPLIVPGRDQAIIAPAKADELRRGDVALYRRKGDILVLHRICKIDASGYYFVGDNQIEVEGPLEGEQIIGKLVALIRKGKQVDLSHPAYAASCWIWLRLRPVRRVFQLSAAKVKAIFKPKTTPQPQISSTPDPLAGVKAVLFDLDGTLVDSMWMWHEIDVEYMASQGRELPDDLQERIGGKSMIETAQFVKAEYDIDQSIQEMMDTWNAMAMDFYSTRVPYKVGAEAFLQKLRSRGIKTAIATSNSVELLSAVRKALHMDDYIDLFLTANEVAHGKPAPDVYLEAAARLGVEPKACLVFEDIIPGIKAGKAAGMRVICIEDPHSAATPAQKQAAADGYITSFEELL